MNRNVLAALTAAAVLVGFGIAAGAGAEGAPLPVLSALSSADGAQVILTGVVIDKVVTDPPYLVVREPWSSEIRLIVLLDAPAEVQRWQTVDVTGVMTTLESDARALAGSSLSIYKDTSGRTALIPLPVFPGDESFTPDEAPLQLALRGEQQMMEVEAPPVLPSPNPPADGYVVCESIADALAQGEDAEVRLNCKPIEAVGQSYFIIGEDDTTDTLRVNYSGAVVDTDRVVTVTGTILGSGQLAVTGGTSRVILAEPGSIAHAKTLPDGAVGTVSDQVVSLLLPNDLCFYTQEADRSAGIRVSVSSMPSGTSPGDVVNVTGAMGTTASGERYVTGTSIQQTSGPGVPNPLGVTNDLAGGGDWYVTPEAGQVGPAAPEHLNNVGLFVKTSGRVVDIENGLLKIDDGSCGAAACPLWVSLPSGVTLPVEGDYVIVTGASSLKGTASAPERLVRVATADDIQSGCWDDTDDPRVAIESPAADGPTIEGFTAVSGTASDMSRITKVQVQVNGGAWTDASYTASTGSWTMLWEPGLGNYSICVRAYDCNGHLTTATRAVSLVDVASIPDELAPTLSSGAFGAAVPWFAPLNENPVGPAGAAGMLRKLADSYIWDPLAWQRVTDAGARTLRMGDISSNWYRWRWGVGAERPPQPVIKGAGKPKFSRSDYGLAEHMQLCNATGAQAVVVLPFFTATGAVGATQEAVNLIRFCTEEYDPTLVQQNWAVTTLDRHLDEPALRYATGGTYSPNDLVYVLTRARTAQESPGFEVPAEWRSDPVYTLVFRCKQPTTGVSATECAPYFGTRWPAFWDYLVTEEEPTGKLSWQADEAGAPAGYWAYARKTLTGREEPFDIAAWELGNELYASKDWNGQPDVDIGDVEAALTGIWEAFGPGFNVGVPISAARERAGSTLGYSLEDLLLMENASTLYSFVIPHLYLGPLVADAQPGNDLQNLFESTTTTLLGAEHVVDTELGLYLQVTEPIPPVWVTEMNTRYGAFGSLTEQQVREQFPHNFRLKGALATAIAQLDLAARGASGSTIFHVASGQPGGSATDRQTLSSVACDHPGEVLVDPEDEESPKAPTGRGWVTPTYYAQRLLSLFATGKPDSTFCADTAVHAQGFRSETQASLFLVNKDPVAAKGIDVGVAERGESPVFVVTLSGSAGMDSNNECTADGRADEVGWPAVTVLAAPTGVLELELPPASMTVVVCELPDPAFELAGQVATPSGEPLSGATIEADSGSATYTATADRLGLFRLNDIPRGTFTVSVKYRDGWVTSPQQVVVSDENPHHIVNFAAVPRLSGTVKRWNQQQTELLPVPGAAVWVIPPNAYNIVASTVADCEGNFVLPVAPGHYRLSGGYPDRPQPQPATVNVTNQARIYDITLDATTTPTERL